MIPQICEINQRLKSFDLRYIVEGKIQPFEICQMFQVFYIFDYVVVELQLYERV